MHGHRMIPKVSTSACGILRLSRDAEKADITLNLQCRFIAKARESAQPLRTDIAAEPLSAKRRTGGHCTLGTGGGVSITLRSVCRGSVQQVGYTVSTSQSVKCLAHPIEWRSLIDRNFGPHPIALMEFTPDIQPESHS
jgi:hypothetical protein